MNLKLELSEFWKWSKKTPNEYSKNRGNGEWETEYPNWEKLLITLGQAIHRLNDNYEFKTAELLIQGLAIDNESELVLDKIEKELIDKNTFVEQVIDSNQPQAKWQIAELLGNIKLKNATSFLKILTEDTNKYVKRRALLSLHKIDKMEAKKTARKYIHDNDEYLKMISTKIINETLNH